VRLLAIYDDTGQLKPYTLSPMSTAMKKRTISGWAGTIERQMGKDDDVLPHAVPFLIHQAKLQVPCLC
jgi:hypothetical protein